jgi:hypothetical protein
MRTSVELHLEQLQAFASNAWLKDNNCPCVAVYIGFDNKPTSVSYPLSIDTESIRAEIVGRAAALNTEFLFTIYPSKAYVDSEKCVLDSLTNCETELVGDAVEVDCLVMVLNECKGDIRRIWAANITNRDIGFWEEYDYLTLTAIE